MSEKQDLARKRNWTKFVLTGISISTDSMSEDEKKLVKSMLLIRDLLLHRFDLNSRSLGLNPKPRCWCGRVGIYPVKESYYGNKMACKYHKDT